MGRGTRIISYAVLAMGAAVGGCKSDGSEATGLLLSQTPPTVQAAYTDDYRGTVIRTISRQTRGGQDYYTVKYRAADGSDHDVVFNGAGNEIDKH